MNKGTWKEPVPVAALRVSQIDSYEIDEGIAQLIREQVGKQCSELNVVNNWLPPSLASVLNTVHPECCTLIGCWLWYQSIYKHGSSLGQLMMDMHYTHGNRYSNLLRWHKYAHLLLFVLGPYLVRRVSGLLMTQSGNHDRNRMKRIDQMMSIGHLVGLLHTIYFLARAGPINVQERMLGLRAVHNEQPTLGTLDMSLQNRELIWHGFAEVMVLFAPLVNWKRWWVWVQRKTGLLTKKSQSETKNAILVNLTNSAKPIDCAFCEQPAIRPWTSSLCGHSFCYFCVQSALLSVPDCNCPECDSVIDKEKLIDLSDMQEGGA